MGGGETFPVATMVALLSALLPDLAIEQYPSSTMEKIGLVRVLELPCMILAKFQKREK
jgi:hypothetical protein